MQDRFILKNFDLQQGKKNLFERKGNGYSKQPAPKCFSFSFIGA
jgi:hypothetical protein